MKRRKWLSCLISLCLLFASLPMTVLADETAAGTVTVGGNTYNTLMEAIDANAKTEDPITMTINGTVTWETGAAHGSTPFNMATSHLTLVGADSNAVFKATGVGVGAVGMDHGTVTFKDLTVVDESAYQYENGENAWEFTYLEFRGNTVFENVKFDDGVLFKGESVQCTGCSFSGHNNDSSSLGNVTMYGAWVANGSASFDNCTFTGTRGLKTHEQYSSQVSSIIVDSCTFDSLTQKPGIAIGTLDADTTIEIKNSKFINCQPGDQKLFIYESDTSVDTFHFVLGANDVTTEAGTTHGNTEVQKAVKATCTASGYTGDEVCSVCGTTVNKGKEIPALGHKFVDNKCANGCGAVISVDAGTTEDSATPEEVKKEEVKEVTVVKDAKTNASIASVKKEAGSVVTTVVTDETKAAKLVNDGVISAETAEKIKSAVDAGNSVEAVIVVRKKTADTAEEKTVLSKLTEKAAKELGADAKVQLLDVSVMLKANGKDLGELHQLQEPITITVAIPEAMKVEGGKYVVLRNHNGVITALETTVNADGTISFTTDQFSTYALAFAETKTQGTTQNGNANKTNSSAGTVKTGDESNVILWIALMAAAVLAAVMSKKHAKR